MEKIRAIIIEDEEPARDLLKNFIAKYNGIELEGECPDGFCGTKMINEYKPNLVFLDIQMPKLTGFEMLELIDYKPVIIFTTAYDQYAIRAFEMNAADYLLKPFSFDRFRQAVDKAIEKIKLQKDESMVHEALIKNVEESQEYLERIAVRTGQKIVVIPVNEIIYLEADGDYVGIHTREGRYLKEKTMKFFEAHLNPAQFVRVHRSFIANVSEILQLEHYDKENYVVKLKNNAILKASSSGYKRLKDVLNL